MTETARKAQPKPHQAVLRNAAFDVERVRGDFPLLAKPMRGKPLVFLDSAASAQKPVAVIEAMKTAMETQYANVHRGLHW
ncbi:MAG: aminotransferase class V-fold PLP-dependent enzyme, partial [Solirubrobacteraceae bacterium]